jgi:aldehyde:ferredoxin oxidoreductase
MDGWTGKLLRVDLTKGESQVEQIDPEILKSFLGGRGLGAYYLYKEVQATADALGPDNILAFCSGPITGVSVPTGGRSSLTTRSPLTGTVFDSNSGTTFGVRLKWAGFDVLLIQGVSEQPVWLEVSEAGAKLHSATDLWGLDIPSTIARIVSKNQSAVAIGPAGENGVLYATISSEDGKHYGRGGVGAVMGSKNLKAILAEGVQRPTIAEKEALEFVEYETRKMIMSAPRTSQGLPEFGTSVLVNLMNWYGVLPTRNFQQGEFEDANKISGERLKAEFLDKRGACWACPITCRRKTHTSQQSGEGPEYETIYALGSDLGISDFESVIEANYRCNQLGLDTISTGGTIACAMELTERGLMKSELRFGRSELLAQTVEDIAYRRGIGDELALGSRRLAQKYGAAELAMQVKGLEMPAYDPRGMQGQGLLYASSNRGACHLRGNMLGPELLGLPKMLNRFATQGKAGILIVVQHTSAVIDSIGMCKFANFAIGDEFFARLLSAITGVHYEVQDLLTAGERIWNLERLYNIKAGFTRADDSLPTRFLKEPLTQGASKGTVVKLEEMLEEYYRFRGWNQTGIPTPKKVKTLRLDELVDVDQEVLIHA